MSTAKLTTLNWGKSAIETTTKNPIFHDFMQDLDFSWCFLDVLWWFMMFHDVPLIFSRDLLSISAYLIDALFFKRSSFARGGDGEKRISWWGDAIFLIFEWLHRQKIGGTSKLGIRHKWHKYKDVKGTNLQRQTKLHFLETVLSLLSLLLVMFSSCEPRKTLVNCCIEGILLPSYMGIIFNHYLRATAHAADPSNSEEEVKEEAMHGWV